MLWNKTAKRDETDFTERTKSFWRTGKRTCRQRERDVCLIHEHRGSFCVPSADVSFRELSLALAGNHPVSLLRMFTPKTHICLHMHLRCEYCWFQCRPSFCVFIDFLNDKKHVEKETKRPWEGWQIWVELELTAQIPCCVTYRDQLLWNPRFEISLITCKFQKGI